MTEHKVKWYKVALLALAIGSLPVGIFACLRDKCDLDFDAYLPAAMAAWAALCGFTAGMLSKSLLRLLLGVNGGGALGFYFAKAAMHLEGKAPAPLYVAILAIIFGAAFAALFTIRRCEIGPSILRGIIRGGIAMGTMVGSVWLVTKCFSPNLLGWTVMALGPFWVGPFLFLWFITREKLDLPAPAVPTNPKGLEPCRPNT